MRAWVLLGALCCASALRPPPTQPPHRDVVTGSGVVRGYLVPRPPHYAFLGVPYAHPPAVRSRFKSVEDTIRWDGVLEATYRVRCGQPGRKRDTACLVLNVFVPEHVDSHPVLVHLHAGHFATGWGSHTAPPRLLSRGFVVVTLNYRLGAEGFLCLGTGGAPGNAGLKDQVAALAWVNNNIAKFGGDPSQVTLYGTGAGAAAAEFLLLSGAIDGFIQRVIMESGSALAPTSLAADPYTTALDVARALGYEGDETNDDLTTFYQNIAIEKTLNYSNRFMPCIENVVEYYSALLIKDPKEILQSAIFKPVPLLIAYSKERSIDDDSMFHELPNNFEDILPNNLEFESEDMKFRIGEQVKESYFGEMDTGVDVVESYEGYINDVFTVYPLVKSATMHAAARSSPVYLMEFFPRDESNTIFEYIFGKDLFSEDEELIAEKLVTMWSNFMMYSDPTPLETSLLPVVWLPVAVQVKNEKLDISTASCLLFDLGRISLSMGTPSSGNTLTIWDHIYGNFYKSHTPSYETSDELTMYGEVAFISALTPQGSKMEEQNKRNWHDTEGTVTSQSTETEENIEKERENVQGEQDNDEYNINVAERRDGGSDRNVDYREASGENENAEDGYIGSVTETSSEANNDNGEEVNDETEDSYISYDGQLNTE